MKIYSFEKLEVWQNSRVLVTAIYQLTKKFPQEERFGLTNQLRRASVSVSSNIAEGNSRFSPKDKAHFFQISFSSLMEVLNQLILAHDLQFISEAELLELRPMIDEIANKLNALYNSQFSK